MIHQCLSRQSVRLACKKPSSCLYKISLISRKGVQVVPLDMHRQSEHRNNRLFGLLDGSVHQFFLWGVCHTYVSNPPVTCGRYRVCRLFLWFLHSIWSKAAGRYVQVLTSGLHSRISLLLRPLLPGGLVPYIHHMLIFIISRFTAFGVRYCVLCFIFDRWYCLKKQNEDPISINPGWQASDQSGL